MSYEFYIDQSVNTAFIRHSGKMKLDEALDQLGEMIEDPLFQPGTNMLRDTRSASLPEEWDYKWFREISPSRVDDKLLRLGRCRAAWVTKSGPDFRVAHQVSISDRLTQSTIQRHAFTKIEPALSWLGISEDYKINFPD